MKLRHSLSKRLFPFWSVRQRLLFIIAVGLFYFSETYLGHADPTDYLYYSNPVAYDTVSGNWYYDAIYDRDTYTWVPVPSDEWEWFADSSSTVNWGDLLESGDNFVTNLDEGYAEDTYNGQWYVWNPGEWDDLYAVAGGYDTISGPPSYDGWEYFYALDGLDPTATGAITLCYAFNPTTQAWYQGSGDTDPSTWTSCSAPDLTDFAFGIGTYDQFFGWTYHIIDGVYYANQTSSGYWYYYSGSALTLDSAWYMFDLGDNPQFTLWQTAGDSFEIFSTLTSDPSLNLAGDGIPDWWKAVNALNVFASLASAEYFGDDVTDLAEYDADLAAYNASVSGDLVDDLANFEAIYIDEFDEAMLGGNPNGLGSGIPDTDGDGDNDSLEVFPLEPAFYWIPSLGDGDTTVPHLTLTSPSNVVQVE